MGKKILLVAGIVFAVLIVGVVVLVLNLNGIVRAAVQTAGTSQLGQETRLADASIGLFSGNVTLGGFEIANAEGFSAPSLFAMQKLSVDTDYSKLFGAPVAIRTIDIDQPVLTLEFMGTRSNLQPLIERLGSGSGTGSEPAEAGDPLKLIIDRISIRGAKVMLKSDLLGSTTIEVPAFELNAIGNSDGNRTGEEMGRVAQAMISELTARAMESDKMPPELGAILGGDLKSLVSNLGGQLEAKLKDSMGEVTEKFKDQVGQLKQKLEGQTDELKGKLDEAKDKLGEEARGALGNLLGGGKKDEPAKDPKKD